jgi:transcriptional regulator with XRE-family HTH domain
VTPQPGPSTPNHVDVHVGARIRMRRKILGLSQERLADSLGLTFQQVQKYERGANRVSSSKLYQVARTLETPISYFFDGLADPAQPDGLAGADPQELVSRFLKAPEGLELASLFPRIEDETVRRRLLDLVRALVHDDRTPIG